MADPKTQAATQLRNIEDSTGMSVADFTAAVATAGLAKHGEIVAYFKADHGLTHGNANLLAHTVRERLAGGPPQEAELLAAQYAGPKAALLPIYERLAEVARDQGTDVEQVVQKTGVSFRRAKQFALVKVPSAKRVTLGLNLDPTPDDDRVQEVSGMCSHQVTLTGLADVDRDVEGWIRVSYERAG